MQQTTNKLRFIKSSGHTWWPDDGSPIIGVSEATDRDVNPYVVLRTIAYEHGLISPIVIPRKFRTDLGSIPWLLKVIPGFRPTDPGKRAFLLHDWCYRNQLEDRRIVDAIMYSALIADGMSKWQAFICWAGVRIFGGIAWRSNAKAKKHGKR